MVAGFLLWERPSEMQQNRVLNVRKEITNLSFFAPLFENEGIRILYDSISCLSREFSSFTDESPCVTSWSFNPASEDNHIQVLNPGVGYSRLSFDCRVNVICDISLKFLSLFSSHLSPSVHFHVV